MPVLELRGSARSPCVSKASMHRESSSVTHKSGAGSGVRGSCSHLKAPPEPLANKLRRCTATRRVSRSRRGFSEWTPTPTTADHRRTTTWSILRLRTYERGAAEIGLGCTATGAAESRCARGVPERRLGGAIPPVRALIGRGSGLDARWFGDLRRLRAPNATRYHIENNPARWQEKEPFAIRMKDDD